MPGCARREIVRVGQPGIFHCFSRCVRGAFLLGKDRTAGRDYSHRRDWFMERLELLAANFVIDVGFFAILSNHFHVVLRATPRLAERMGAWEVARRWLRVYPGQRVLDGNWIEPTQEQVQALAEDKERIAVLRKRLSNVSWFMAALSEYMARRSNLEDGTKGRFFGGRYGCKEIRSEGGLLIVGLYNDLNQIRAGEALTPEDSIHCSVWFRIQARKQLEAGVDTPSLDGWMAQLTLAPDQLGEEPSKGTRRATDKGLLPITLDEYLQFLDCTGRELRADKRGTIPAELAPILQRLGLEPTRFLDAVDKMMELFPRLLGPPKEIMERAQEVGRKWLHGLRPAAKLFVDA